MTGFKLIIPICIAILLALGVAFWFTGDSARGMYSGRGLGMHQGILSGVGIIFLGLCLCGVYIMGIQEFKKRKNKK